MARIITIANQKGGVGKSTTAINIGAYLACLEKFVLFVAWDPKANATVGLGIDWRKLEKHIYHSLIDFESPEEIIRKTGLFGYDVLPANPALAGANIDLV